MISLTNFTPDEMVEEIKLLLPSVNLPRFRGKQIFAWIYRGKTDYKEMTDLSPFLREQLEEKVPLYSSAVESEHLDEDGTLKLRIRLHDGLFIEAVLLTDQEGRKTACLSTQAGCAMGCTFCRTGEMGKKRNLEAGEIVEQFLHLEQTAGGEISHIVFMGMGEALDNYESFVKSVKLISHPAGREMSPRRMTLSTCGLVPQIKRLADDGIQVRLAVSLNSAKQSIREEIMPIAKRYSINDLKAALRYHQEQRGKRITLEYVMLGGVNDRDQDLRALCKFVPGLNVVVNLIPWNPVQGNTHKPTTEDRIRKFHQVLEQNDIAVTRRFRRGRGVDGACGQLAT
ncbi:MAG: 23S rRNA (adenine(2503)-C(2))-methyltransferase RlmN [Spirochaetales bacterium]|nr:23S rRNA (adenine(2503)-C(2))-methyltransferase RlmN [Spirochaetales bacterium]